VLTGPKRGTLLIVDDEEGPRQSLKIVFKGDYDILIAKSGEEAMETLRNNPRTDVVISDIRMTGISGIELLAALKKIDEDIQVIMLTAYETIETARAALRLGACDYLNKPFDIPAIRASVAGALEKRQIARQLRENTDRLDGLQEQIQNERIETSIHRTQGEIYASVIHDINNPLTIISCFSEMINTCIGQLQQVEGENLDTLRTHLAQITAQVSKCHDISHRYLGFLRQQKDDQFSVDVGQIFCDLRDLLRSHKEAQGHPLFIKDFHENAHARINGTDLLQILLNLVINAFQSQPGTAVSVAANRLTHALDFSNFRESPNRRFINLEAFANQSPLIEITVSDNGSGIPAELLPRIFEAFFTTKPIGKGTGLGLGIVERLIRKAGGVLHVDSEIGRGTLFTIYLPAIIPE
jgi:signal transduction histidine kinase